MKVGGNEMYDSPFPPRELDPLIFDTTLATGMGVGILSAGGEGSGDGWQRERRRGVAWRWQPSNRCYVVVGAARTLEGGKRGGNIDREGNERKLTWHKYDGGSHATDGEMR